MRIVTLVLIALLPAVSRGATDTPGSLALLVNEANPATIEPAVRDALKSPDRLMRATAARLANVRKLPALLPAVWQALQAEKDIDVAAEMVTAAVMLGEVDTPAMLAVSDRFQSKLDRTISLAIARARPATAIEEYINSFRARKVAADYFLMSLWGRPERLVATSARLLGLADERGWVMVLDAAEESALAAPPTVVGASLTSKLTAIRSAAIWYVVRGYHPDPARLSQSLREAIAASDSVEGMKVDEEFGRELVRRMFGQAAREHSRWLDWLRSAAAHDERRVDSGLDTLLTDRERKVRWENAVSNRPNIKGSIQSTDLGSPAYVLPSLLPAGLAGEIIRESRCRGGWLGLARTTVDLTGRVQAVDLANVNSDEDCLMALRTLIRLSLAANTSIVSAVTTDQLVVKGPNTPPCFDAASLLLEDAEEIYRVGGSVKPPVVIARLEPVFPADARQAMAKGSNVIVIAECEISRTGCVRRIRLLKQSPFGSLNAAAVYAVAQWKFKPATLDGEPVSVVFNLTINFKVP